MHTYFDIKNRDSIEGLNFIEFVPTLEKLFKNWET